MNVDTKDIVTTIVVPNIPSEGLWTIKLKNGDILRESKDFNWTSVKVGDIDAINVFGILIPKGANYDFYRTASASVGKQPLTYAATVSVDINGLRLIYRFVKSNA